jgi:hypothetical protein
MVFPGGIVHNWHWIVLFAASTTLGANAQSCLDPASGDSLSALVRTHEYIQHRSSSYDRSGANDDARPIDPGTTLTLLDEPGPGVLTHIWLTVSSPDEHHLKQLVLRIYWDGESTPSVETPIGDFFGLGLGDYYMYESVPLSVGADRALNSFFVMPYRKHARITVTNDGPVKVSALYYNIDYRSCRKPLPSDTLYFHAQYRQAAPLGGWTKDFSGNGDPKVNHRANPSGGGNYVWLDARGQGHFVGVTMSILQNQDGWWGEGDDMFFIDGEARPTINGTGAEDYFLGAWGFGSHSFSYGLYGAPVKGSERINGRSSVYRFHLDSPIPFTQSLRATIEHGHANHRSDNYFSVAYWYQSEPHGVFPPLPSVGDRIPRLFATGGPGTATALPGAMREALREHIRVADQPDMK